MRCCTSLKMNRFFRCFSIMAVVFSIPFVLVLYQSSRQIDNDTSRDQDIERFFRRVMPSSCLDESVNDIRSYYEALLVPLSGASKRFEMECKQKRSKLAFLWKPHCTSYFRCNVQRCILQQGKNWTMITFVKSAAGNFKRREFIRETWGKVSFVNGGRFGVIFVVGRTLPSQQKQIDEEASTRGDILQANIPDNYTNIVMKTLAGMQWASENLPEEYFYSSADDDFIVDLVGVHGNIENASKIVHDEDWPDFPIICMFRFQDKPPPIRKYTDKNYMTENTYKWPFLPRFCSGGMYTTKMNVIRQIFELSKTARAIPTDDVWLTGILRHILGMPDEMLIPADPPVAFHIEGHSHETFNFTAWKQVSSTLKHKNVCFK